MSQQFAPVADGVVDDFSPFWLIEYE